MAEVHVAIDLESLDLRPSALILSVGLSAFTLQGGEVSTFYAVPSKEVQLLAGRTTDAGTKKWWDKQEPEAKAVLDLPGVPVLEVMDGIDAFFKRFSDNGNHVAGVWGYGSDFDNAMIQDFYATFGRRVPWRYTRNRCGRTVVALANVPFGPSTGIHHNALDDARFQARMIREALIKLGVD